MDPTVQMAGTLDPRGGWEAERCPIAGALDVLSARSSFLILREAFYGTSRFDDFVQRTDLSDPVTALRLRELVDQGLLERQDYQEPRKRTRQSYRLTPKGADLFPVLASLMQWGQRWLPDAGRNVSLRHQGCGQRVDVQLRCAADHRVASDELELFSRTRLRAPAPAR